MSTRNFDVSDREGAKFMGYLGHVLRFFHRKKPCAVSQKVAESRIFYKFCMSMVCRVLRPPNSTSSNSNSAQLQTSIIFGPKAYLPNMYPSLRPGVEGVLPIYVIRERVDYMGGVFIAYKSAERRQYSFTKTGWWSRHATFSFEIQHENEAMLTVHRRFCMEVRKVVYCDLILGKEYCSRV